jgi:hypothetical protein
MIPTLPRARVSIYDPIYVGIEEYGAPVYLELPAHNLLAGGEPGGGKSGLLNAIAAHAALRHPPGGYPLKACSLKSNARKTARTFMGFTGLVPSEYSSGDSVHRGRITKAGNAHLRTQLIESAWSYQHRANLGPTLRRRQQHAGPATVARSWTAQQRLCARYRRLAARKTSRNVVTVAIARELAGFLWAEMTATD